MTNRKAADLELCDESGLPHSV